MRATPVPALLLVALLGCGDGDPAAPANTCDLETLPLSGNANAPVVLDVGLEVQSSGIVVVATASDPQGFENLRDVVQSIGVFPDARCAGTPGVVQDDLAATNVEETFGTAIDAGDDPDIHATIAAAISWPVEVDFRDADGNRTTGRVNARVIP